MFFLQKSAAIDLKIGSQLFGRQCHVETFLEKLFLHDRFQELFRELVCITGKIFVCHLDSVFRAGQDNIHVMLSLEEDATWHRPTTFTDTPDSLHPESMANVVSLSRRVFLFLFIPLRLNILNHQRDLVICSHCQGMLIVIFSGARNVCVTTVIFSRVAMPSWATTTPRMQRWQPSSTCVLYIITTSWLCCICLRPTTDLQVMYISSGDYTLRIVLVLESVCMIINFCQKMYDRSHKYIHDRQTY